MARRGIKKMGAVLIAAGLSIAMCSPSVSANVRTNINTDKITQKKTARYVEPEEWNKEELTAYQFDSEVDMMKMCIRDRSCSSITFSTDSCDCCFSKSWEIKKTI